MAGLKTFWILISTLFLLAACVPQTKQTECDSNEAFNASLRTCVPIVGGPSSFVKVDEYTPENAISRSKGDFSSIVFQILSISNPYNQSYSVRWERVFNGVPTALPTCNDLLTCNVLRGYDLGTTLGELGVHVVTAKLIVGGAVVDSQNFQLKIEDFPKPTITESTVKPLPSSYNLTFTPDDGPQEFSFQIKNNATLSALPGVNWRVNWSVTKNGVAVVGLNAGDDMFTLFGASQANYAYLGTALAPTFDPSTLGVGSYTIRAIVKNDSPGEIVDERLWVVTVKYPDFGVITGVTAPLTSVTTTAFYNIDYSVFGFRDASAVKGNYCVRVSKPEGVFTDGSANDPTSYGIVVRYYKDGVGSPIFEDYTDDAISKDTVCFSDAPAGAQQLLFFSDGSPTTPHMKKLVARVFDAQTDLEMCVEGTPCSITYPVKWDILVKPQNSPALGVIRSSIAGDNITYTSSITSTTTSANATVTQDSLVKVKYKLTDDALEHDPFTTPGKFKITGSLKRGLTPVATTACDKDFTDPYPGVTSDAGVNSINLECTFTIASSDASGPIPNSAHTLTIQIEDLDSPATVANTGAGTGGVLGTLLTLNLTVLEKQTVPTISLANFIVSGAPIVTPVEGNTVTFQFNIADAEKDNYTLTVKKCATAACLTAGLTDFAGNTVTPVTYLAPVSQYDTNTQISYVIPENAIGNAPSGTLYFKAFITDIPNTPLAGLQASTAIVMPVTFYNPPPVIANGSITPAMNTLGTAYNAFSGYRFEVSAAAAITDASNPSSGEGVLNHSYQWWISPDPGAAGTWTKIDGADKITLRWTPGPEITAPQNIKLCVSDESFAQTGRPNITSAPDVAGTVCSQTMFFTPKPNLSKLSLPAGLNGEVAVHHVPAERTAYVAYATNSRINVEKFTYDLNGDLNTSGMRLAEFNTVSAAGTSSLVKNLSITASGDWLYIAYASDSFSSPGNFQARVRKINISNAVTDGTKSAFTKSTRKMDFSYTSLSVDTSNCPACSYNPLGRLLTFDGSAMAPGDTVSVQVIPFTAVSIGVTVTTPPAAGTICGNCSAASQAQSFIDALNSSASTDVQGLTGVIAGSTDTVAFKGIEDNSFYDHPDTVLGVGKIVIAGGSWYLPVINSSLGGANQNKIQILSALDGDVATVNVGSVATTLDAVATVDNAITTTGSMLLGYVTLSGSQAKLAETTVASGFTTVSAGPLTVFSGSAMTSLKVKAALASNPNVFVVGKDSSNVWRVARVAAGLGAITRENTALAYADITDASNSSILTGTIADIDVQPALPLSPAVTTNEARMIVLSNAGGSYKSYLFRWKQIASTPFEALDASGSANRHLDQGADIVLTASKVVLSPATSVTIGDAGNTAADKTNSAMTFLKVNSTGRAEFGILNTEIETINSTTRDASGFFRPAMVR